MSGFCYVASPYTPIGQQSAEDAYRIREERFQIACRAAAMIMRRGLVPFSPIAHGHPIETFFETREGWEFWKGQNEPFLQACERLIVLTIPGWQLSTGVGHEIAEAARRGIPIEYVSPESLEDQ
jgi:hypothetical protein